VDLNPLQRLNGLEIGTQAILDGPGNSLIVALRRSEGPGSDGHGHQAILPEEATWGKLHRPEAAKMRCGAVESALGTGQRSWWRCPVNPLATSVVKRIQPRMNDATGQEHRNTPLH
jgi:hypothetical protein